MFVGGQVQSSQPSGPQSHILAAPAQRPVRGGAELLTLLRGCKHLTPDAQVLFHAAAPAARLGARHALLTHLVHRSVIGIQVACSKGRQGRQHEASHITVGCMVGWEAAERGRLAHQQPADCMFRPTQSPTQPTTGDWLGRSRVSGLLVSWSASFCRYPGNSKRATWWGQPATQLAAGIRAAACIPGSCRLSALCTQQASRTALRSSPPAQPRTRARTPPALISRSPHSLSWGK